MRPGPPHEPNSVTGSDKRSPPFEVIASPQENGQVIVFLRSLRDQRAFRGFMLMAEVNGDRGHGYFVPADESAELAATMDCENLPVTCTDEAACQGFANAIAHSSPEDKVAVTSIWTPPSQMSGQVTFVATFVGENDPDLGSTWWENVRSSPIDLF